MHLSLGLHAAEVDRSSTADFQEKTQNSIRGRFHQGSAPFIYPPGMVVQQSAAREMEETMAAEPFQISAGLMDLKDGEYAHKKVQMNADQLTTLVGRLHTWFESNNIDQRTDAESVARVIANNNALKAFYKPTGKAPHDKIGDFAVKNLKSVADADNSPKYADFSVVYKIGEQPKVRRDAALVLRIIDKGHPTHGANFSGNQTLKQIIDNLCAKVSRPDMPRVEGLRLAKYPGYALAT